ncbi:hypothetical protein [Salinivibrio socompensis]|uniref:hypothetical protein n=1 Tax=Salinivibrio socompensis TaxID=1510206 RepID=UPI0004B3B670|nr:hypothetical protein [Salinivibrio socompensis]
MQGNYWQAANQKLLAKAISELHFENAITVDPFEGRQFRLALPDAEWLFSGTMSIWGMVIVDIGSVSRDDNQQPALISLVMDLQPVIKMDLCTSVALSKSYRQPSPPSSSILRC